MNKEYIKKWLKNHKYCVLATCCHNKPWAATVDYTCDDNLNIFISTNPQSLKCQNLIKNPIVCLVIDSQTAEGTLQIQGRASTIKPKNNDKPNILIKPTFMIYKKLDEKTKKLTIIHLTAEQLSQRYRL